MTLLQTLVKKGIIDKKRAASLEYEIKSSNKKEEEVLIEKGIIAEEELFEMKAEDLKIPYKKINVEGVPLKVLEIIPEESARYYKMIPIAKEKKDVEVGMVYPEDLKGQEALKFLARQGKFTYRVYLISLSDFNNLLKQSRTLRGEVERALGELKEEMEPGKIEVKSLKSAEFERMVEEAPVTKVVGTILRHAVEGEASDVHIEPTKGKLRVRFRMDGILHSSLFLPLRIHAPVITRIKILSDLKIDETRMPQDGRFSTQVGGRTIDFRVSTFPTILGEKVAIRILDPTRGLLNLKDLGLTGRNFKVVQKAIKKPFGLILASGPTGSGKTTTLYAVLRLLNKEEVNIVTLEDPVEYHIEGVNQSRIKPEIGYDFAIGLRNVVRQDPDIIMVGEIRDEETATLVTHAALTGHLVLSTVHTADALGTIPRLIDLGIKPFLIPSTVNVALAQRLVRKICPYCRKKVKPNIKARDLILKEINSLPPSIKAETKIPGNFSIYEAPGCKKCNFKGRIDRIAIFEVLVMTDQLAEIILRDLSEANLREEAKRQGMLTMRQDGILKVLEGIAPLEEVIKTTEEQ